MQGWFKAILVCTIFVGPLVFAQQDVSTRANALYRDGKRIDALPLYEELAKAHPDEMIYQERLADCLSAASTQTTDAATVKALRLRERDAAKRAIELGDPVEYLKIMANLDPDAPIGIAPESPGAKLLQEGEKAFGAGDFATAMAKYVAAVEVDPNLYQAALFAGDTAYTQHDLPTAAKWFARAIKIDPNRETAYRYWGDAIMRYGSDPDAAKGKFIDAVVAEPYNNMAWQGIKKWAQYEKAVILPPKIDRPAGPQVDPKNPKNINITINPGSLDEKKNPGAPAWMMYPLCRAGFHGDRFAKEFPAEKDYRHSLKEESDCLGSVATVLSELKVKPGKLDESLRNLVDLKSAGMIECFVLINAADEGIVKDYDEYRSSHRALLHDYIARFVVHGGINPAH
jgi:tetratricopeptide (TPR) repeat protein